MEQVGVLGARKAKALQDDAAPILTWNSNICAMSLPEACTLWRVECAFSIYYQLLSSVVVSCNPTMYSKRVNTFGYSVFKDAKKCFCAIDDIVKL